jgi:hypothetical protein
VNWVAVQSSPAFGFTVVGLVVVFGPIVAERLRLVLDIALGFVVLGVYCFAIVPAIARWFFTGIGQPMNLPVGGTVGA